MSSRRLDAEADYYCCMKGSKVADCMKALAESMSVLSAEEAKLQERLKEVAETKRVLNMLAYAIYNSEQRVEEEVDNEHFQ